MINESKPLKVIFICHFIEVLLLSAIIVSNAIVFASENKTEAKTSDVSQSLEKSSIVTNRSDIGRAIKDNSSNGLEKSKRDDHKNKESKRKEADMMDMMRLHQIATFNTDYNKEVKDLDKKEKGKLQTVGGVVGEIIAVIVSEVVKLFGNMVSDVAREVTAHGFVSIFKQFTDYTGISLPEL